MWLLGNIRADTASDLQACFAVAKLKDLQQHQDYEEAEASLPGLCIG